MGAQNYRPMAKLAVSTEPLQFRREPHRQIGELCLTPDPFAHLPNLRGTLTPADKSEVRVTTEVLAFFDERARQLGRPENWRLSDHQREESRRALLGDLTNTQDLWVYGYGSLMWDPGFHFAEVRLADIEGFQRRFTYKIAIGRGTPEHPALMVALEQRPGRCRGLAFRIAADMVDAESEILWRREMLRGGYNPAMLPVTTPQGAITALVFTSKHSHPDYVGERPLPENAALIVRACGPLGSNRDYLEQLADHLTILEIEEEYIEQLLKQVKAASAVQFG